MKRVAKLVQYVACQDCGKRIMATLAKKGICPACHVANHGPVTDVHISAATVKERE
jgi:hypothetical protein